MSRPLPHEGGDDRDLALGQATLEMLFRQSPVGLYVFDLDLRLVRYSLAAGDLRGVPPSELLGRPFRGEVTPPQSE